MLFCIVSSGSVTNFFPTVVRTLGYDDIITLLLTAPPYVLAVFATLLNAWHADETGERYLHVTLPLCVAIGAYILAASTTSLAPRYFAMMLMVRQMSYPNQLYTATHGLNKLRVNLDFGGLFQLRSRPGMDKQLHPPSNSKAGRGSSFYQRRLQHVEYLRFLHVSRQRCPSVHSCVYCEWHDCFSGHMCRDSAAVDAGQAQQEVRRWCLRTGCYQCCAWGCGKAWLPV